MKWSVVKKRVLASTPSRRSYKNGYVYEAFQVGGCGSECLMHLNTQ